ncbi:MAG: hypothetical protein ACI9C2_000194 [Gammaproteobacteria bacterium]|jgi:hypothetical protein
MMLLTNMASGLHRFILDWRRVACVMLIFGAILSESLQGQESVNRNREQVDMQSAGERKSTLLVDDYRPLNRYSFADGVTSLVKSKQSWREERKCISCHTTGWGLAAQPAIDSGSDEVAEGRAFAQEYLTTYLDEDVKVHGQYGSIEGMVATSAFLAMSDARSGNGIHKATRQGLDYAWKSLDESGTWEDWLQCNWPPFESDAEFGPTLMLVALGELREIADLEDRDEQAAEKLSTYLRDSPPLSLHAKAMRLWAASSWPKLIRSKDQKAWLLELTEAQATDGGWSMASLSGPAWKRDGGEGQTTTSEAYPTAFAIYVLLKTGLAPEGTGLEEGLRWLREHQREGGDWFTRSPRRDRKHYISRAATAFALMALAEINNTEGTATKPSEGL